MAASASSTSRPFARRVAGRVKRTVLGGSTSPVRSAGKSGSSGPVCLVCLSPKLRKDVIVHPNTGREVELVLCSECRYVSIPGNAHDYSAAATTAGLSGGLGERCATVDTPGRETGMAKLGQQVLRRQPTSVLVYGAGQSLDVHHIAKLPRTGRVAIGDLVKLRDDAPYVDINQLGTEKFDVVVASEVLEHFPDPRANLANLFSYVKDDGIIVASTNIRDNSARMDKHGYLYIRGHVSYFSPRALRLLAEEHAMFVDFRVPLAATRGAGGKRKRYIMFSRSRDVMDELSNWFGSHMYAPSEAVDAVRKTREQVTLPPGVRVEVGGT